MPKRNEVFITAAIPRELAKRLKDYALQSDDKMKVIVRNAIVDYLDKVSGGLAVESLTKVATK